jgi:cell division protein ZipA
MSVPMMSELRWALLILGVIFIALLAWWERRRPRPASRGLERALSREGGADAPPRMVREPPLTLPEVHVREPLPVHEVPVVDTLRKEQREHHEAQRQHLEEPDEPEMPVLEAESPPPAAAAPVPQGQLERPPFNDDDTVDDLLAIVPAQEIPADERATFDDDSEAAAAPAEPMLRVEWPEEHERRILALRLVAPQRERFAGRSLRQALAAEGFLLGQFAIFHKPDDEQRAVLSAASLTRPGTFDMETMDSQHYGGLSLFAVLPGPKAPPQAFDELVFAARNLNERLHGELQDEQGTPLTPARIAQLREQLRPGARS